MQTGSDPSKPTAPSPSPSHETQETRQNGSCPRTLARTCLLGSGLTRRREEAHLPQAGAREFLPSQTVSRQRPHRMVPARESPHC